MKRRKRLNIRLIALGLAAAAISAPVAQAVRVEHPGLDASVVENRIISPDDRVAHATWTQQPVVDHRIISPDDRVAHATWTPQPAVAADDGDGVGTTSVVSGLVLLLVGSFGVALIARSVRKGRLAPT